jgi:hypothetical protein
MGVAVANFACSCLISSQIDKEDAKVSVVSELGNQIISLKEM